VKLFVVFDFTLPWIHVASTLYIANTHLKYTLGCPLECFTKTPMKQAPIQIALPWMSWREDNDPKYSSVNLE